MAHPLRARYAIRQFWTSRVFTAAAVLTLASGTMLTLVNDLP
jgi:hypothetical protein